MSLTRTLAKLRSRVHNPAVMHLPQPARNLRANLNRVPLPQSVLPRKHLPQPPAPKLLATTSSSPPPSGSATPITCCTSGCLTICTTLAAWTYRATAPTPSPPPSSTGDTRAGVPWYVAARSRRPRTRRAAPTPTPCPPRELFTAHGRGRRRRAAGRRRQGGQALRRRRDRGEQRQRQRARHAGDDSCGVVYRGELP